MQVPSTDVCAVSGVLIAGADCANTTTDKTYSLSMHEFLEFLEPQAEVRDASGKVVKASRGAAMCQSSDDYKRQKTAIEKACYRLGNLCTYEIKKLITEMDQRIDKLQKTAGKNVK